MILALVGFGLFFLVWHKHVATSGSVDPLKQGTTLTPAPGPLDSSPLRGYQLGGYAPAGTFLGYGGQGVRQEADGSGAIIIVFPDGTRTPRTNPVGGYFTTVFPDGTVVTYRRDDDGWHYDASATHAPLTDAQTALVRQPATPATPSPSPIPSARDTGGGYLPVTLRSFVPTSATPTPLDTSGAAGTFTVAPSLYDTNGIVPVNTINPGTLYAPVPGALYAPVPSPVADTHETVEVAGLSRAERLKAAGF